MSIQSEMSCREIMQCNRKQLCLFAEGEKKACWELVQENDAYSFHICVDCLVYLAKHPDSILTEEELHFILEQRKDNIQRNKEQNLQATFIGLAPQVPGTLKSCPFVHREEISI